jgi:hypothetical protein
MEEPILGHEKIRKKKASGVRGTGRGRGQGEK